jgi:hypothetical protein
VYVKKEEGTLESEGFNSFGGDEDHYWSEESEPEQISYWMRGIVILSNLTFFWLFSWGLLQT